MIGKIFDISGDKKMQGVKQEIIKILDNLPDDCTLEDIQYHIYVLQKIEKGLKDAEEGRVYSQEEMEKRMSKWLKK
jgi:predicted transcriptional regulator